MKLNLTTLLLASALIAVSIVGVNQCTSSRKYRRDYIKSNTENVKLKTEIRRSSLESDSLNQRINTLSLTINKEQTKRKALISSYTTLKSKMEQTPTEDILESLLQDKPLSGELYEIDSTRVLDYGMTKLEMKECSEVTKSLTFENKLLKESVADYALVSSTLLDDLDDCVIDQYKLQGELDEGVREEKRLKGKIWSNRGISGVLVAVLVVIAVL